MPLLCRALPIRDAVFALLVCLTAGCGGVDGPQMYTVSGQVTFQGTAVTEGDVNFFDAKTGKAGQASIGTDGSYRLELESGDYSVTITPPFAVPENANSNTPLDGSYKKVDSIPPKYHVDSTSGFTALVTDKAATFDFEMK